MIYTLLGWGGIAYGGQLIQYLMDLPDEYQHVEGRLISRLNKMKKVIIVLAIISLALLVSTIVLAVQHSAADPSSQNADLKAENERLLLQNQQIEQVIEEWDQQNTGLQQSIKDLDAGVNATGMQIDELQSTIHQNCDITRQKLYFNQTNLNAFSLSIPPARQAGLPSIASLSLMGNNLTRFCDNSLPDLQSLDLRYNRLLNMSNNYLPNLKEFKEYLSQNGAMMEFSGNVLPLISDLDLSSNQIVAFRGNVMPQLKTLNLDYNNLSGLVNCTLESLETLNNKYYGGSFDFLNNSFPKLANISSLLSTTVMTGNLFGQIKTITLSLGGRKQVSFEQNRLPALTELWIQGVSYDMAKLVTNIMPQLSLLDFRWCNLVNFNYYKELRLLSQLGLDGVEVGAFSNHEYPSMKELSLVDTRITQFANNKLPALEKLTIIGSNATDICSGNLMLGLKKLTVKAVESFVNNNYCLSKFEVLESLEVRYPTLAYFRNYNLPQLQSLNLQSSFGGQQVVSFQNNTLPKLKQLILNVDGQVDLHPHQETLEELRLSGPLTTFNDYYFQNLKVFSLEVLKAQNTSFTNCTFPLLEQLFLSGFNISLQANRYTSRLHSIGILNGFKEITLDHSLDSSLEEFSVQLTTIRKFSDHSMPKLTNLYIGSAELYEFSNNSFPLATEVYLANNYLSTFDCRTIPAVRYLYLNDNQFMDGFVDGLISCNLANLSRLDLRNNHIMDPTNAYDKLTTKYPGIQLYL